MSSESPSENITAIPDRRITDFIVKHHVMTLACSDASTGAPYCCNLFYTYSRKGNYFIFTSSPKTLHASMFKANNAVAASIVLETAVVGKIRGLQLCGTVRRPAEDEMEGVKIAYLKKFPYAIFMDLDLWIFEPSMMKYTDNRLGFGTKLLWDKN